MASPTFCDIQLSPDGDLPDFTSLISGSDAVLQRISFRLQLHLGEFIYTPTRGLPYKQWQSLKPLPSTLVQQRVRAAIETVPGVDAVRSISVTPPTGQSRTVTIAMQLQLGREVLDIEFGSEAPSRRGNISIYVRSRVLL